MTAPQDNVEKRQQSRWVDHLPRPFRTTHGFTGLVAGIVGVGAACYYGFIQHEPLQQALLSGGLSALGLGILLWLILRTVPGFDV